MRHATCATVLLLLLAATAVRADEVDDLLKKAADALDRQKPAEVVTLATEAIRKDGKNARAYSLRAAAYSALRKPAEAIADLDKVVELSPTAAGAFDLRGSEHFKLGHIKESIEDFDRFLKLRPDQEPGHWKRGISFYYAGRYDEGRKQFEGYEKVDTNDVENAVWRYLCMARKGGAAKARADILKIGNDRRVPMMQVYDLFRGKLKPEDVLAAVPDGNPAARELHHRNFYAHLYLGLYYETEGDAKKALDHLNKAADEYMIGHYMGDVARVHRDLLKKK